tara:strand:- start:711 stop:926 length:216 start_codon:yes stop_codon:yes gene_type:complete
MARSKYERAYQKLVVACYIAIASYEKYLLDQITSQELAEIMKALLDKLPEISSRRRESLRDTEGLSEDMED